MMTSLHRTWITSDLHFYHEGIIKFESCKKFRSQFKDVQDMNTKLIEHWNMNAVSIFSTKEVTMSSREIAELSGKDHKNVLADIRKMLTQLDLAAADFSATALVQKLSYVAVSNTTTT